MHTVRRQAHRYASQGPGDGTLNYNPFARTRSRDSPADTENNVNRTRSTRSENHVRPTIEEQRGAEKDFGMPNHHNTEPTPVSPSFPDSSTIPESSAEKSTVPDTNGPTKNSGDSTAIGSSHQDSNGVTNGVTKRAKFKGIFRKDHEADEGNGSDLDRVESEQLSLDERKKKALKKKIPVGAQIRFVLFGAWINVLLIFVPVGFAVYYARLKPVPVFIINFIAIIPLAAMLSSATEELAIRVGETMGGLLNASFGNAVELIVSVQALIKDEITIVKTSLIGSMLSNLLLVMGMSFFLGGINRLEQFFNVTVAQTAASLLALCIASLIIPTVFHNTISQDADKESEKDKSRDQALSRGTAIILLIVYACYLGFQLKTHSTMYNEPSQKTPKRKSKTVEEGAANRGVAAIGAGTAAASGGGVNMKSLLQNPDDEEEEEDDFESPSLSVIGALVTLAISTTLVAFCSEFMVSSIDGLTATGAVSKTFVGLILLPIVGNAAEHATAVTVAIKDKMDLAIGVAIGSSMQIALLVFPLIITLGWILSKSCMTLYFDTFQIATLFVSVLLVNYLIQDGKSHWLEGVLLMASYIIIALAAWYYPNEIAEQCYENGKLAT